MRKFFLFTLVLFNMTGLMAQSTVLDTMAMRVSEGTSKNKIEFRLDTADNNSRIDFFRISSTPDYKVLIEGNNNISLAVGLNYYLKNIAGIHISWNNLTQKLPDIIPLPESVIYRETDIRDRYYLNYCTFSYSMSFWDEDRWMKEIDWMALHGINIVLSMTGIETVWKNLLTDLGYSPDEICAFIPGPAYLAWWQMNNLEGWGGPLTEEWFTQQESLQKKIIKRMNELDIKPVLPGYSGMVPRNFGEKLGYKIEDPGLWCGFPRPAFLSPEDSVFNTMADLYYEKLTELYGVADYYSMDPFHEGGNFGSINLGKVGAQLYDAMKRVNPKAKWVIQSWQSNPQMDMIDTVPRGNLLILDLYSEKIPKWENIGGYNGHDWLYCMLLNFGGNIGMHGRINSLIDGYRRARNGEFSSTFTGIGATPEGIENNPIMYELLFELPWMSDSFSVDEWLTGYLTARYGTEPDVKLKEAWNTLVNTVYNAPVDYKGEGTVESIICARPTWFPKSASTWGNSFLFYSPDSTAKAARLLKDVYDNYSHSDNFKYDFIDINRQANADEANRLINHMSELKQSEEMDSVKILSAHFLDLILRQDSLLSLRPDTHVDTWIQSAVKLAGDNDDVQKRFRENAAMQITVWGDSIAANQRGLHDYSHREWGGIIKELYYPRWKAFFEYELNGGPLPDYYQMEKEWIRRKSGE